MARTRLLALASVTLALLIGCSARPAAVSRVQAAPATERSPRIVVLDVPVGQDAALTNRVPDVKAVVTDRPSSLTATSAVAAAIKESRGPAAEASTISCAHVVLTRLDVTQSRDMPAWMVTFHDVTLQRHGGSGGTYRANWTVFLDERGEMFLGESGPPTEG